MERWRAPGWGLRVSEPHRHHCWAFCPEPRPQEPPWGHSCLLMFPRERVLTFPSALGFAPGAPSTGPCVARREAGHHSPWPGVPLSAWVPGWAASRSWRFILSKKHISKTAPDTGMKQLDTNAHLTLTPFWCPQATNPARTPPGAQPSRSRQLSGAFQELGPHPARLPFFIPSKHLLAPPTAGIGLPEACDDLVGPPCPAAPPSLRPPPGTPPLSAETSVSSSCDNRTHTLAHLIQGLTSLVCGPVAGPGPGLPLLFCFPNCVNSCHDPPSSRASWDEGPEKGSERLATRTDQTHHRPSLSTTHGSLDCCSQITNKNTVK